MYVKIKYKATIASREANITSSYYGEHINEVIRETNTLSPLYGPKTKEIGEIGAFVDNESTS